MKGRVLILTGANPNGPGGVEHFVRDLTAALERRGYSVQIFCEENSVPASLQAQGGKMRRRIASNLLGYFVGRSAKKAMGADVAAVISNGDLGWCAPAPAAPSGKRIHMYHGTYRGQAEAIRPFISPRGYLYLKWWESGVLEKRGGRNRLVLCNSTQTRDEVSRMFGYDAKIVWLPLDLGNFRRLDRSESRRQLGLAADKSWGLFVGSTNPAKGFDRVRQLMDALPEVDWIVVLSGDVPPDIEKSPRVRVIRSVSEKQLPAIYSAADFTVCPSYYESFGYVVAESLACGTPVISSPGGASGEFLKASPLDRLLIPNPWSTERAVAAIRAVLSAPDTYREKIEQLVWPRLTELMSPDSWSQRFFEAVDL